MTERGQHSPEPPPLSFHRMGHLALRVRDLERSIAFYTSIFGMELRWREEGEIAFLSCGQDDLALFQLPAGSSATSAPAEEAPSAELQPRLDHFGFRVHSAEEVDRAAERIRDAGVPHCGEPVRHRDGAYSFYVPDPDGHLIQVLFDPALP